MIKTTSLRAAVLLLMLPIIGSTTAQQTIDLSGKWHFSFSSTANTDTVVLLPGSMLTNNLGNEPSLTTPWTGSLYDSSYYFNPALADFRKPGNLKFPFFLTPNRHYVGRAFYSTEVEIPASWQGRRIEFFMERPHIETTLYIDGQRVGHDMSLSVPHVYDITDYVKAGSRSRLKVEVYNGIENVCVGQDSHSVTDQTQGNWNGIVGRIELRSTSVALPRLRVYTDIEKRSARIVMGDSAWVFDLGQDAVLWSEHTPKLYRRTVVYGSDTIPVCFGLRSVGVDGRNIVLNGRPIYIRGTVENCLFPLTGFPPTDVQSWLDIIARCKEYGLNMIRFHSYCPPEAAFTAADSLGFYLQPEGPSWPNHGVRLRRGMSIDSYLEEETKRICDEYGNHPSFVFMAAGNEPAGDWVAWCHDWVNTMRSYDDRRIYCGASVGGGWAWDEGSQFHVKGGGRGLDWTKTAPQTIDDYTSSLDNPRNYRSSEPCDEPILAHEQGQWCVFPDLDETDQYTGVYKALNFELFAELLKRNGMESRRKDFLMASGRLQLAAYKYEMERNLRTPGYSGFQLLGINDYSGQGTALVGPLNVFWKPKAYVDAPLWRSWCSEVVPMARMDKFVFTRNDTLRAAIELYNASATTLDDCGTYYTIVDAEGKPVVSGNMAHGPFAEGKNIALGNITLPLTEFQVPAKYTLLLTVRGEHRLHSNTYDFWVYRRPGKREMRTGDIYICNTFDTEAAQTLSEGGTVLIEAANTLRYGQDVKQSYLPVFWNTSWFKMRPPHTTGAVIDTDHPLFRRFPTDSWSNLNWWELLNGARVINLSEFPQSYQPAIQPIDTWHISRKLGMIAEVHVGAGRLFITTMDISRDLEHRHVARQMRRAILSYMQSDDFKPATEVSPDVVRNLFEKDAPVVDMYTKQSPDELKPKIVR